MIKAFFKLIRWPNLMIIFFSMFFMLFLVIRPVLGMQESRFGMNLWQFVLLVVATLFIAAGGYIINDIKDQEADAVNHPEKNQIGKNLTQKQAALGYVILSLLGLFAGFYLSYLVQKTHYSLLFLLTVGLLWYYAERYQCQPIVGNLVIASLSALSFGLVWLYEIFRLQSHGVALPLLPESISTVNTLVAIYMGFAFLSSWLREIIKDLEDLRGDEKVGCLTYPVAHGTKKAKSLAIFVNLLGLFAAFYIQWLFYTKSLTLAFWYFMLVDALFIFVLIRLWKAKQKEDYSHLSIWVKVLMLTGILSMTLFYFEF